MRARFGATGPSGRRGLALAGIVIFATVFLNPSSAASPSTTARSAASRPDATPPQVVVFPTDWWMPTGNSSPFTATWIGPGPNCTLTPAWYRWSASAGPAQGTLTPEDGPSIEFSAVADVTGSTTLLVRSEAVIDCGPTSSAVFSNASAVVTVAAPIEVLNLSIGPGPILPGASSFLRGWLSGGEPPYALEISWGDGSNTSAVVPGPGPFAIPHAFPEGTFDPSVAVTDADGLLTEAAVGEALTVTPFVAVGIDASAYLTDVGVPVQYHATILDPPPLYDTSWGCGVPPPGVGPSPTDATSFSCAFSEPGTASVAFDVLPPFPYAFANASLDESVVPLPAITVPAQNLTGEVGQRSLVEFNVSGGVPPFALAWNEAGSSVSGRLTLVDDGAFVVPIVPTVPGALELVVRLVDADGASTSNSTARLLVAPSLDASAAVGRAGATGTVDLALAGTVIAGAAPFQWFVVPGVAPLNESPPVGELGGVGPFGWFGAYRSEGEAELTVTVVDGAGGVVTSNFSIEVVPALAATVTAPSGGTTAGQVALNVSVTGGAPPFALTVNASDGERWNATLASDGDWIVSFSSRSSGSLLLTVALSDALGATLRWNVSVEVAAGPASQPTPSGPVATDSAAWPEGLGVFALVAAVAVLFYRRRRGRPAPPAPPDPVAVLREIIAPADGADRATVELLAEEAGVPLDVVRATLDRLIADGTIRTDADAEQEAISWSAPDR